jgi:E3 ubiquitin-protein ligase LRSAM1
MESDQQLENILNAQGQVKVELVGRLQKDEELQCAAVGALLERSDARSWSLVHQVSLVESQLAALTAVEMERRKLHMSQQVVCMIYQNNMYNNRILRLWSSVVLCFVVW